MRQLRHVSKAVNASRIGIGLVTLAGFAAILGGCSTYRQPAIQVQDARVTEQSDEAIAIGFELLVENPIKEPLKLLDLDYRLWVDGREVHGGRRSAESTLGGSSKHTITIPAVAPFNELDWTSASLPSEVTCRIEGTVTYLTPGEIALILFESGVWRPSSGFSHKARIRITDEAVHPAGGNP
jgi:hypothetical protein